MSEPLRPDLDPGTARPMGEVRRYAKRKLTPGHWALAVALAVIITAAVLGILSLILWAIATLIHH